jgi:hypothetical protein
MFVVQNKNVFLWNVAMMLPHIIPSISSLTIVCICVSVIYSELAIAFDIAIIWAAVLAFIQTFPLDPTVHSNGRYLPRSGRSVNSLLNNLGLEKRRLEKLK